MDWSPSSCLGMWSLKQTLLNFKCNYDCWIESGIISPRGGNYELGRFLCHMSKLELRYKEVNVKILISR